MFDIKKAIKDLKKLQSYLKSNYKLFNGINHDGYYVNVNNNIDLGNSNSMVSLIQLSHVDKNNERLQDIEVLKMIDGLYTEPKELVIFAAFVENDSF